MLHCTLLLLARLRHTGAWETLHEALGGHHKSRYILVFNDVVSALHSYWVGPCSDVTKVPAHAPAEWADAVYRVTEASPRVLGFLDGTFISVSRPGGPDAVQRSLYSRYYKGHGLKYQGLTVPNGLILDAFGPVIGSKSDSHVLHRSGLLDKLRTVSDRAGCHLIVYADSAYAMHPHVLRGYKRNMIHDAIQREMQKAMNSARTSVEWGFGIVQADWPFVTAESVNKINLSQCGKYWQVAAFISNCKTCMNGGNLVSDYFGLTPPTLAEFLAMREE